MLEIYTSVSNHGSMKSLDANFASVLPTRTAWLTQYDIKPEDTTLVHLTYDGDDYARYYTVNDELRGDGVIRPPSIAIDGLATTVPGHALFLPLADCIGAVLHDAERSVLMLSHLGRHNLVQYSGTKSIEYMCEQFGCIPENITAWLSPAAGGQNYPLYDFDNRSLHDVATEQLVAAGVKPDHITRSPIDTTTHPDYYSHSQFLAGKRTSNGRFAVVAIMRDRV